MIVKLEPNMIFFFFFPNLISVSMKYFKHHWEWFDSWKINTSLSTKLKCLWSSLEIVWSASTNITLIFKINSDFWILPYVFELYFLWYLSVFTKCWVLTASFNLVYGLFLWLLMFSMSFQSIHKLLTMNLI